MCIRRISRCSADCGSGEILEDVKDCTRSGLEHCQTIKDVYFVWGEADCPRCLGIMFTQRIRTRTEQQARDWAGRQRRTRVHRRRVNRPKTLAGEQQALVQAIEEAVTRGQGFEQGMAQAREQAREQEMASLRALDQAIQQPRQRASQRLLAGEQAVQVREQEMALPSRERLLELTIVEQLGEQERVVARERTSIARAIEQVRVKMRAQERERARLQERVQAFEQELTRQWAMAREQEKGKRQQE